MEVAGMGGHGWKRQSRRTRGGSGRSGRTWVEAPEKEDAARGWKWPEWEKTGGNARVGGRRQKWPKWEDMGGSAGRKQVEATGGGGSGWKQPEWEEAGESC